MLWLVMLKTPVAAEVWQRRQGLAAWQVFNGASATWQPPSQTLTDTTSRKGPISRMRKLRLRDAEPPMQGHTVELGCELEGIRLYVLSLANPHPGQSRQWKLRDIE